MREQRASHVPADRKAHGFLSTYTNFDNLILGVHHLKPFCGKSGFLNFGQIKGHAERLAKEYDIRPPVIDIPTGSLSGGNQQKLIVAREFSRNPKLLIIAQPTRGVDIGAIEFIHQRVLNLRDKKVAVLLVSAELEEIHSLSDRTLVMFEGKVVGEIDAKNFDARKVGMMMLGNSSPSPD
jgi:simple sugar transport system ATP-binding protein